MQEVKEKKKAGRDANGRFMKGASGNPGGREKTDPELLKALKALTPKCVEVLKAIIENEHARDQDRIRAIEVVFDRCYGKPYQAVKIDELDTNIRIVDMDPEGAEYNA